MNAVKGTVVKAIAGRDNGKFFVVTETDGKFCYIADGKERKLSNPKKKALKHVSKTLKVIDLEGITDKKLRKTLSGLVSIGG